MTTQQVATTPTPTMGEFLKGHRERLGVSKAEMGRRLGVLTHFTYRSWENDERSPAIENAQAIADVCEVSRYRVLTVMGILTAAEAHTLEREMGADAIPGYHHSIGTNDASKRLLRVVA